MIEQLRLVPGATAGTITLGTGTLTMTLRPHNSPLPDDHPLRKGFVAFGMRPPQANTGDAPPASLAETEDDPEGIRMELLRRARARAMVANAIERTESVEVPQMPVDASRKDAASEESLGDTGAS